MPGQTFDFLKGDSSWHENWSEDFLWSESDTKHYRTCLTGLERAAEEQINLSSAHSLSNPVCRIATHLPMGWDLYKPYLIWSLLNSYQIGTISLSLFYRRGNGGLKEFIICQGPRAQRWQQRQRWAWVASGTRAFSSWCSLGGGSINIRWWIHKCGVSAPLILRKEGLRSCPSPASCWLSHIVLQSLCSDTDQMHPLAREEAVWGKKREARERPPASNHLGCQGQPESWSSHLCLRLKSHLSQQDHAL